MANRPNDNRPSRRHITVALTATALTAGVGWPSPFAKAQTAPHQFRVDPTLDSSGPPRPGEELALVANLLTRMATRTEVNGRRGYSFVIDTGAARTALAWDVARDLGLEPGPPLLVHGITAAETVSSVRVPRLSFGGRRFNDIIAPVFTRETLGADGLLGLDVLSRFELAFDLRRRTVIMKPSGPDVFTFGQAGATASRLTRTVPSRARQGRFGQLILINTRIDGVLVEAFVDSGAQFSIGNLALRRAISTRQTASTGDAAVRVFGVIGQSHMAQTGRVSDLRIGRHELGRSDLLFADLHAFEALDLTQRPALLIGADILYRFDRVTLNFGQSHMGFSGLRPAPVVTLPVR